MTDLRSRSSLGRSICITSVSLLILSNFLIFKSIPYILPKKVCVCGGGQSHDISISYMYKFKKVCCCEKKWRGEAPENLVRYVLCQLSYWVLTQIFKLSCHVHSFPLNWFPLKTFPWEVSTCKFQGFACQAPKVVPFK